MISLGSIAIPNDRKVESAAIDFVCCETDIDKDKKETTGSDSISTHVKLPVMEADATSGAVITARMGAQKEIEKVGDTSQIQTSTLLQQAKQRMEQPKKPKNRTSETYLPFPLIM